MSKVAMEYVHGGRQNVHHRRFLPAVKFVVVVGAISFVLSAIIVYTVKLLVWVGG